MKKVIALIVALVLALSMGVLAFAEDASQLGNIDYPYNGQVDYENIVVEDPYAPQNGDNEDPYGPGKEEDDNKEYPRPSLEDDDKDDDKDGDKNPNTGAEILWIGVASLPLLSVAAVAFGKKRNSSK